MFTRKKDLVIDLKPLFCSSFSCYYRQRENCMLSYFKTKITPNYAMF